MPEAPNPSSTHCNLLMLSPAIVVSSLSRAFRTYRKAPGFLGALKGLIHREFDTTWAVRHLSFEVAEGEMVGFLGSNGAGKTTTLKMLSGLLHPTSGDARVLGYRPWERINAYRRQFALLLGQKNQLWWDLPARDSLELNAKIYRLPRRQFVRTVEELASMLSVRDQLGVMVRELSLGERMKMELIAALLHQPRVLFLDEPTIGLDVISQKTVREFLREYNRLHRTTILLTSHDMADVEALCRRVIIIEHGRRFFDGALGDLIAQYADVRIIQIETAANEAALWRHRGWTPTAGAGNGVEMRVPRADVVPACRRLMEHAGVVDIRIKDLPVDEVVRNILMGAAGEALPSGGASAPTVGTIEDLARSLGTRA
jgi:ABC-2 type transport system ATP-binding protein